MSLKERQREAIVSMLSLTQHKCGIENDTSMSNSALNSGKAMWKVVVYDKRCQDILAPLLKVGGLRRHGVTLHLNIDNPRAAIRNVPVVYFLDPTEENVDKIISDCRNQFYETSHINFSATSSDCLLQKLASGLVPHHAAATIASVTDRCVDFVCLGEQLFSVNLPSCYSFFKQPHQTEASIGARAEKISQCLLSVCITLGVAPVVSCSRGDASEVIATRLHKMLLGQLEMRSGASPFAKRGPGATSQRSLLLIVDRDFDLAIMLQHTWLYQPLIHDLFNLRLGRVVVPPETPSAADTETQSGRTFDLDSSDLFWQQHAGVAFPTVANAIHEQLSDYNEKMQSMQMRNGADIGPDLTMGLATAIDALPEMTERKRSIDMHTNIATALVREIRDRELDVLFEIEDGLYAAAGSSIIQQLDQRTRETAKGRAVDKMRLLLTAYLKKGISETSLAPLVSRVEALGVPTAAYRFLQHNSALKTMQGDARGNPDASASIHPSTQGGSAKNSVTTLGGFAAKVSDHSRGLLQGVKTLLPQKRDIPLSCLVDDLMQQKKTPRLSQFLFLEPRAHAASGEGNSAVRHRAPFMQAIVFVVGGGNFVEYHALQDLAQRSQKQILYGATDMTAPESFLEELHQLGASL